MAERGNRKVKIGRVSSDKMNKSRVIVTERNVQHPLYGKTIKKTSKFMAHDEKNDSHEGDLVVIMETRPLSRRKRWRVVEILEKAK
ncbi:MAG: 30S ribosomal protein S17 [candidate division KSB1 bacterium]|nr:30S ribosomal protein S17 [candidate division KSB1 bacterium]MDZ7317750.1 30S ribosomal protein S17 [candidate division KSB1 bacterium]